MQLAGRLYSAWSLVTANLSSVVFYNPDNGRFGDWKTAPALVLTSNETISKKKEDGVMCNDDGKKCKAVGKGLHRHEDEIEPTFVQQFKQTTDTSTMTMTTQGQTITTRVLVVPTLTVIAGEAITTEVMLDEQGGLMESSTLMTATVMPSTASRSSSITVSISSTDTATGSSSVATMASTLFSANPTTSSKALIEAEEEEEDGQEEGDDESDVSSDSTSSEDEEDEEEDERPKVLKVSKNEYIRAWKRDIQLSAAQDSGTVVGVNIAHLSGSNEPRVVVTQQCALHYGWAINSLDNLVREETVLAAFFIWILGLAIVGLLNESIPHLTVLGSTVVTLIASGVLCWKIREYFGWQTFQRIGGSSKINKIYKLLLALSILLQLDAFVLVTLFALFLDQAFKAIYSLLIVALLPWLYFVSCSGWDPADRIGMDFNPSRTEKTIQYICGFISTHHRWMGSIIRKPDFPDCLHYLGILHFFTCMGSLAVGLTTITVILAIIRRLTFGKGLADFLYLEEVHERPNSGLLDEKPSMPVAMPRSNLPTFSTAFGPGPAPPPRQMFPPMPVYTTATRVTSWNTGDDRRAL
ncbi:uncharacterized protein L199_005047 [Kwoniella botswanensis]|uniref:uncharacterized protein n=1 Tax=Kwoniella botswanensis TaxID=1268659 RepID=UPI00315CE14F